MTKNDQKVSESAFLLSDRVETFRKPPAGLDWRIGGVLGSKIKFQLQKLAKRATGAMGGAKSDKK